LPAWHVAGQFFFIVYYGLIENNERDSVEGNGLNRIYIFGGELLKFETQKKHNQKSIRISTFGNLVKKIKERHNLKVNVQRYAVRSSFCVLM
jgi:hypothetical protein